MCVWGGGGGVKRDLNGKACMCAMIQQPLKDGLSWKKTPQPTIHFSLADLVDRLKLGSF